MLDEHYTKRCLSAIFLIVLKAPLKMKTTPLSIVLEASCPDHHTYWVGQKICVFPYDVMENPNKCFGQPNIMCQLVLPSKKKINKFFCQTLDLHLEHLPSYAPSTARTSHFQGWNVTPLPDSFPCSPYCCHCLSPPLVILIFDNYYIHFLVYVCLYVSCFPWL